MKNKFVFPSLILLCFIWRSSFAQEDEILNKAYLDRNKEVPIIYLRGNSYEIGYQEGRLLKEEIESLFLRLYAFARKHIKIPFFWKFFLNLRLDRIYKSIEPFISENYKQELKGLAQGSGISLKEFQRLHTLSEIYPQMCSSFSAFGKATSDGRLYHMRNFDWSIELGIQDYPVIKVYHLEGKIPFVSIGYIGFIGVLSGINAYGISIAQIGAKTIDVSGEGIPMPLLLRKVLEEAQNLDSAIDIVKKAKRTQGNNYVFASSFEKSAVVIETTANLFQIFYANDEKEKEIEYALPIENALLRADTAMDIKIRDKQLCSQGDPYREGLEVPYGSSAYDKRYKKMAEMIKKYYSKIDSSISIQIAREVAPSSNLQSIVYSFPDIWIALSGNGLPAGKRDYKYYNLIELLGHMPVDTER